MDHSEREKSIVFTRKLAPRSTNASNAPVEIDATHLTSSQGDAAPMPPEVPRGHAQHQTLNRKLDPDLTIIGSNFQMEGESITIRCGGTLSVNGNVDADLHCDRLDVGDAGRINGEINAHEIDVHGQVQGTINAGTVTLHPTAQVEGDIASQYLTIERGARFEGRSSIVGGQDLEQPELLSSSSNGTTSDSSDLQVPLPESWSTN